MLKSKGLSDAEILCILEILKYQAYRRKLRKQGISHLNFNRLIQELFAHDRNLVALGSEGEKHAQNIAVKFIETVYLFERRYGLNRNQLQAVLDKCYEILSETVRSRRLEISNPFLFDVVMKEPVEELKVFEDEILLYIPERPFYVWKGTSIEVTYVSKDVQGLNRVTKEIDEVSETVAFYRWVLKEALRGNRTLKAPFTVASPVSFSIGYNVGYGKVVLVPINSWITAWEENRVLKVEIGKPKIVDLPFVRKKATVILKERAENYSREELLYLRNVFPPSYASIVDYAEPGEPALVFGVRGTGKTYTLMATLIGESVVYITYASTKTVRVRNPRFFKPSESGEAYRVFAESKSLDDLISQIEGLSEKTYLVLDDIHYMVEDGYVKTVSDLLKATLESKAVSFVVSDEPLLAYRNILGSVVDKLYKARKLVEIRTVLSVETVASIFNMLGIPISLSKLAYVRSVATTYREAITLAKKLKAEGGKSKERKELVKITS